MSSYIIAVDQGSSSTKALAFDQKGRVAYRSSRTLRIERPQPSHVEQDPIHVLEETRKVLQEILSSVYADGHEVVAIGLACQRSSFILWDRNQGKAYTPIISWQDLRAKDLCEDLSSQRDAIYEKTGLPLTGHYGGPKFLWLMKHDPRTPKWVDFQGTVYSPWNSFLLWHLTEERVCATDESIAGRTLFFNIHKRGWDLELLRLFRIPETILPQVLPTCHSYGHFRFGEASIPLTCSIGDHQAALLGLGGLEKGQCGLNYGTSAGCLVNIGETPRVVSGLLTSIAYSVGEEGEPPGHSPWPSAAGVTYCTEGTVNAVGSLFEWFETEKGIKGASRDWASMMAPSSQGWYMLPGMYGIAAPYWKETAPTEFQGQGEVPSREVMLRAGMESIGFLVADVLDRLRMIPGLEIQQITAAGGAARPSLLQFQADILGLPIVHASVTDATALGCAFLTGLQLGFWKDLKEIQSLIQHDEVFYPRIPQSLRRALLDGWHDFLKAKGIL